MNNTKETYYEVDAFLNILGKYYLNKLPIKLRELFSKEKSTNYEFQIDPDKPIKDQEFSDEALAIIAFLNLKYWCTNEEEKKRLNDIYLENEKNYEKGLINLRNNSQELFKKTPEEIKLQKNPMVVYEETSIFKKILINIKKFFTNKR